MGYCISLPLSRDLAFPIRLLTVSGAALLGGVLGYQFKRWHIKMYFKSSTKRELEGKTPCLVQYKITDQDIEIDSSNCKLSFPLDSLEDIKIDDKWLEAKFESGLCLLPLSTFENNTEQKRFIAAIKQEL